MNTTTNIDFMQTPIIEAQGKSVPLVIPIYKERFSDLEFFSINYSLQGLPDHPQIFIAPKQLDLGYYKSNFPKGSYIQLQDEFFYSQRNYNQLCYEPGFYRLFEPSEYILILQPDALVVNPGKLDKWLQMNFDYVGAPEGNLYRYNLAHVSPFGALPNALKTIHVQGLNGGLSLRRVQNIIAALNEYPTLTSFFRSYAGGVGEDIFFSVMTKVTAKSFLAPNEILASDFALTDHFKEWIDFNQGDLPFGFHAWYKTPDTQEYILSLIKEKL